MLFCSTGARCGFWFRVSVRGEPISSSEGTRESKQADRHLHVVAALLHDGPVGVCEWQRMGRMSEGGARGQLSVSLRLWARTHRPTIGRATKSSFRSSTAVRRSSSRSRMDTSLDTVLVMVAGLGGVVVVAAVAVDVCEGVWNVREGTRLLLELRGGESGQGPGGCARLMH